MNTVLYILAIAMLVWPVLGYLEERRKRRFAEARLSMAQAVNQAEELMLAGEMKLGEVCHDHVFASMYASQFLVKYPMPVSPSTDEAKEISKRIRAELADGRLPFAEPIFKFSGAYMDALVTQDRAIYLVVGMLIFLLRPIARTLSVNIRLVGNMREIFIRFRSMLAANSIASAAMKSNSALAAIA